MAEQTYNQRYADGDNNTAGAFGFDQVSSVDYAISKVAFGDANTITRVTASAGLPVTILAGSASIGTLGANSGVDIGDVTINNSTGAAAVNIQDGGNSITVDGTITAELSAVDNAVLDAIAASLAGTLTVGSHAVTNAGTFAVQVNGDALTALNALVTDAAAIETLLTTIEGNQLADGHNVTVDNASIAVTGTFWQATQPVSLASVPSHAVTNAGTFAVQAAQSGTWTVDLGATDNAVLDTIATPIATIGTTPLQRVAIFDASNAQITSFGGGVQYTEGDTDASITGTACMWEDTSNTLVATSAAKPFPVEIVAGAGSGGTAAADDADFTAGTTSGTPVMGVYESTPSSVTDGDLGIAGITATRQLRTSAAQSGTWTVDLGATDNAVLDAIAASLAGTLTVGSHAVTNAGTFAVQAAQSGTWNITNVSGTVSLPTGASTAANQSTIIGHVDGIETLLGTIDADTSTLAAKDFAVESGGNLASIASTLSGWTKMNGTVDTGVLRVTVASDSTGVLASIGSISTSVTPGTGATNLGKAEDAAHSSGDVGVAAMTVRQDTAAALSGTDGDYQPLITNASGHLHVVLPTTQTIATVGGVTTLIGGSLAHDAADIGINPHKIGGYASASAPTDVSANGDIVNAWFVRNGAQAIQPTYAGVLATTGNGASGAGVQRVTIANDSTGILAGVTTVTTVTTCSTVTTLTGSSIAHDSADSGNPHKIGAKATTSLSGKTMVANDDRSDLFAGVDGVQITRNHTNLEDIVTATPVAITDGSSTSVVSAQGAGVKTYVTSITIANSSATFVTVDLRDGTAGSVKWTFPVPATGGVTHTFDPPLPFSANTAVAADPSAAASTITVSVNGFRSKV